MKNNLSCAWYWRVFGFFFPPPPPLSGVCRPFHSWGSQQPALQEVATVVEGLIASKSRMGGTSRSEGADVVLGVAPVL